jgi:tRNA (guanosine-2'-O-)-methyltransferase
VNLSDFQKNYELLSKYATPKRKELIELISKQRTNYITVVLEDVHHPQNISAVMRSCDCFGIKNLHIIENRANYNVNPKIVRGADKWVDIVKYNSEQNNTLPAINKLKADGYRIVAATPHENDVDLHNFCLNSGPVAFFFGAEQKGISKELETEADEFIKIPMYGFTESLNISVAAGILIQYISLKLRQSDIKWQLSDDEICELRFRWLKQSVKNPDFILQRFLTKN